MRKINGIYLIKNNISNTIYVGSSKNILRRFTTHKRELRSGKHLNKYLQRSWNKYEEENFEFQIIEECSEESLYEREQFWFDFYKKNGLVYNQRPIDISSNRGIPTWNKNIKNCFSKETIEKLKKTMKKITSSEEYRKKISNLMKGHFVGEETRLKISISNKNLSRERRKEIGEKRKKLGLKHTEEAKAKMRLAKLGTKQSEETIKKRVISNTGKKRTEETKNKMRGTNNPFYGKHHSEESKQKMRIAHKKRRGELNV
jgi:group I intron endonuclease